MRGTGRPKLNPFVLPSSSTVLFGLLIVAALTATTFAWNTVALQIRGDQYFTASGECRASSGWVSPYALISVDQVPGATEASREYIDCMASEYKAQFGFLVLGLGLLSVLTAGIYLALPWWKSRRRQYRSFPAEDARQIVEDVGSWASDMGIEYQPDLLLGVGDQSTSGLVFGRPGKKLIGVPQGLAVLYHRRPKAFKGVLVHELAHLRNRDVDRAYLTVAIWRAFVVVSVVPLILALLTEGNPVGLAWRAGFLAAVVFGLRNAVLRQRELFADARAGLLVGEEEYAEVIGTLPPRSWYSRFLSYHPEPSRRLGVLSDPGLLMRFNIGEAIAAGIVAGLVLGNATSLFGLLDSLFRARLVAAFLVAGLLALAVVIISWRAALSHTFINADATRLAVGALAVGPAFLLARWASFHGSIAPGDVSLIRSPYAIGWALTVVAAVALVVLWTFGAATFWFPSVSNSRSIRILSVAALGAGSLIGGVALGALLSVEALDQVPILFEVTRASHELTIQNYATGPFFLWAAFTGPLFVSLASSIPAFVALLLTLFVPLLGAWWLRSTIASSATWPLLGGDSFTPTKPGLSLGSAGRVGIASAAGGLLLVLGFRVWIAENVPPGDRLSEEFIAFVVYLIPLIVSGVTIFAAGVAAVLAERFRWLAGLLAGGITAILASLSVPALNLASHCLGFIELTSRECNPADIDLTSVRAHATWAMALAAMVIGIAHLVRAISGSGDREAVRLRVLAVGVLTALLMSAGAAFLLSPHSGTARPLEADPDQQLAYLNLARDLGAAGVDDDQLVALGMSYCARLHNGEPIPFVIDQVSAIPDDERFELELDALAAAVYTLCPEFQSDWETATSG